MSTHLNSEALRIAKDRYFIEKEKRILETDGPDSAFREMCYRVSAAIAAAEISELRETWKSIFFDYLYSQKFVPGGRFWANAGTSNQQYPNCFILPILDHKESIFKTLGDAAIVQSGGGGTGFSFSRLRSRGMPTTRSRGVASGPVSFLKMYDAMSDTIVQGGCVTQDTLISTEFGLVPLSFILDKFGYPEESQWKKVAFKIQTHVGEASAVGLYNNGKVRVKTVRSSLGYFLTTSLDHKYKVFEGGSFVWKSASELKVGDYIALDTQKKALVSTNQILDTAISRHFNSKHVIFPSFLSPQLAEFLGLYLGDGYNTKSGIGFSLNDQEQDTIDFVYRSFWDIFQLIPAREKSAGDGNSSRYIGTSVGLKRFLVKNGLLKQSRANTLSIPEKIFYGSIEIQSAFLRGLFEADGSISKDAYGNIFISFTTASRKLAQQVHQLLLHCGVISRLSSRVISKEDKRESGGYGDSDAEYFHIGITTDAGREAFLKNIGFISTDKQSIVEKFALRKRAANDRVPGLQQIFSQLYEVSDNSLLKRHISPFCLSKDEYAIFKGKDITRKRLLNLAEENPDVAVLQEVVDTVKSTFFDQIVSVSYGVADTYDIEVEGVHEYLANGIAVHNSRRSANMGILNVDHPDILEFIFLKDRTQKIRRYNVSVNMSDSFMQLSPEKHFVVYDPYTSRNYYVSIPGLGIALRRLEYISRNFDKRVLIEVQDSANPRDLVKVGDVWNAIVTQAHACGDPGLFFGDAANRMNPLISDPYTDKGSQWYIHATNPCGEIPMADYEICMLGAINLSKFVTPQGSAKIQWEELGDAVRVGVRFLDNGIDTSEYPLPENAFAAKQTRRIGLGIMGFADMLINLKITYGSERSIKLAEELMQFINQEALKASIALGEERGNFPLFTESAYSDGKNGFPKVPFLRNSFRTTIAPTGTTSILAMTSSGIEPLFELEYIRKDETGQRVVKHPLWAAFCDLNPEHDKPEWFVTAMEIPWEKHVEIQAAFQKHVDNSISKTINLPESATVEDINSAYRLAYKLGCKGITIYRDKSKEVQVLNKDLPKEREELIDQRVKRFLATTGVGDRGLKRERSEGALPGQTYKVHTGEGGLYITINRNGDGQPFELFATVGKGGSDTQAFTEAIGRLVSLALQYKIPAEELCKQLIGISGSKPIFHQIGDHKRILSVPDAIGKVLQTDSASKDIETISVRGKEVVRHEVAAVPYVLTEEAQQENICPTCNEEYRNVEGCKSCSCGSKCD